MGEMEVGRWKGGLGLGETKTHVRPERGWRVGEKKIREHAGAEMELTRIGLLNGSGAEIRAVPSSAAGRGRGTGEEEEKRGRERCAGCRERREGKRKEKRKKEKKEEAVRCSRCNAKRGGEAPTWFRVRRRGGRRDPHEEDAGGEKLCAWSGLQTREKKWATIWFRSPAARERR